MNSEKRSRTVRNDSLDMATIVPHPVVVGKTHAEHQTPDQNEHPSECTRPAHPRAVVHTLERPLDLGRMIDRCGRRGSLDFERSKE
jgi:hypothetical protein